MVNYFTDHALLFFDALEGDDSGANSAAKVVLDQLLSMAVDVGGDAFKVSRRDLHDRLRNRRRFRKIATLDAPLELLVERGFIQVTTEPTGGRSSTIVHLNPRARNPQNPQKGTPP